MANTHKGSMECCSEVIRMSNYLENKADNEKGNVLQMYRNPLNTTVQTNEGELVVSMDNSSVVDLMDMR